MKLSKKHKNIAILVAVFVGGVATAEMTRPYLQRLPLVGKYFL